MKHFLLFCSLVGLILGYIPAHAQPSTGGPSPGTGPGPVETPLDGGVSLLLVAGAAYGLRRLRGRHQPF